MKVPRYEQQQTSLDVPNVVSPKIPIPDISTSKDLVNAKRITALGEGMSEAVNMFSKIYEQKQDNKNKQELAYNYDNYRLAMQNLELSDEDIEIGDGDNKRTIKEGVLSRMGRDADGATIAFDQGYAKIGYEYSNAIKDPVYRAKLEDQIRNDYIGRRERVIQHERTQLQKNNDLIFKNTIANSEKEAPTWINPTLAKNGISIAMKHQAEWDATNGVSPEVSEANQRDLGLGLAKKAVEGTLNVDPSGTMGMTLLASLELDDMDRKAIEKGFIKEKNSNQEFLDAQLKRDQVANGVKIAQEHISKRIPINEDNLKMLVGTRAISRDLGDAFMAYNKMMDERMKRPGAYIVREREMEKSKFYVQAQGIANIEDDEQQEAELISLLSDKDIKSDDLKMLVQVLSDKTLKGVNKDFFNSIITTAINVGLSKDDTARDFVKGVQSGLPPEQASELAVQQDMRRQSVDNKKEKDLVDSLKNASTDQKELQNSIYQYVVKSGADPKEAASISEQIIESAFKEEGVQAQYKFVELLDKAFPMLKVISPEARESFDAVNHDKVVGDNLTKEANSLGFFGKIKESFIRGDTSSKIDILSYGALVGEKDFIRDVKPYRDAFYKENTDNPIKGGNIFTGAIFSVANMLPAMGKGILQGKASGALAATGVAIAGQLGPQVATPEEIVTVPAAFAAGSVAGSIVYWYQQGAGQIYAEMMDSGISDSVAVPVSHIAGALYGSVEFLQVDKLIPGGKDAVKKTLVVSVKKAVGDLVKRYGVNWATEVGEEGIQEVIQASALEFSNKIEKKTNKTVGAIALNVMTRGWNAIKESALPMLLLMGPKAGVDVSTTVQNVKDTKIARDSYVQGMIQKAMEIPGDNEGGAPEGAVVEPEPTMPGGGESVDSEEGVDPLIEQAKKFETAGEFIEANSDKLSGAVIETKRDLEEIGFDEGIFNLAIEKGTSAESLIGMIRSQVGENKDVGVYTTVFGENVKALVENKRKLSDRIKTKPQLQAIWEEAHAEKLPGGSEEGGEINAEQAVAQGMSAEEYVASKGLSVSRGMGEKGSKEFKFFENPNAYQQESVGVHFGTRDQAEYIAKPKGGVVKDFVLDIKNPVRLDDKGSWSPSAINNQLFQKGILSREEYDKNVFSGGYDIRRILKDKGYDGIVYKNVVEGEGDSYIAFDKSQILDKSQLLSEYEAAKAKLAPKEGGGIWYHGGVKGLEGDIVSGMVTKDRAEAQRFADEVGGVVYEIPNEAVIPAKQGDVTNDGQDLGSAWKNYGYIKSIKKGEKGWSAKLSPKEGGINLASESGQAFIGHVAERIASLAESVVNSEKREGLYQSIFNRFQSIENLSKKAKDVGAEVEPGEDPGLSAMKYLSSANQAMNTLENGTYEMLPNGSLRRTGEGVKSILRDYDNLSSEENKYIRERDLQDYLVARRTIEDLQRKATPESKEDIAKPEQVAMARLNMERLETKYGKGINNFSRTAERLYDFQQRVLHSLVDSGLLSEKKYQDIIAKNPNYIPFDRVLPEEFTNVSPVNKSPFSGVKNPVKKIKGSDKEIQDVIGSVFKNTYLIMDRANRNKVFKDVYNLKDIPELGIKPVRPNMTPIVDNEGETIFRPSPYKPQGNIVEGYIDGKRKYIEVPKNVHDAMMGLNEQSSHLVFQILSKPASWLRTGATITPEFVLRNPIRDQWTSFLQTQIGVTPFVDAGAAIADIIGKSDMYNEWIQSGGSYAGFVELSRPAMASLVKKLQSDKKININIVQNMSDLSQLMEQATRVGVYKKARARGLSPIEAAKESREATIDFSRRGGSFMRDWNSVVPFFNAGLQGLDKMVRSAKKDPGGFMFKSVALITVPSILLYLRNREDPEYFQLQRWEKDLFWNFKIMGIWFKIPKPFGYGQLFGSLPERFMEYLDTKDPMAMKDIEKSLLNSLVPFGSDILGGSIPAAIKPIVENKTNWNFFRQRKIVPEYMTELIPEEQYSRYDSETAKILGKIFKVSPSKLENLIIGWTGGSGRYVLQAGDLGVAALRTATGKENKQKRPMELTDIPLVKGFVARRPSGFAAQSVSDFYDFRKDIRTLHKTINKYEDVGKYDEADAMREKHPEVELYTDMERTGRELSELANSVEEAVNDKYLSDKEKRNLIQEAEDAMLDIAKDMNREYKELKYRQ